jgi:hypothetical protein
MRHLLILALIAGPLWLQTPCNGQASVSIVRLSFRNSPDLNVIRGDIANGEVRVICADGQNYLAHGGIQRFPGYLDFDFSDSQVITNDSSQLNCKLEGKRNRYSIFKIRFEGTVLYAEANAIPCWIPCAESDSDCLAWVSFVITDPSIRGPMKIMDRDVPFDSGCLVSPDGEVEYNFAFDLIPGEYVVPVSHIRKASFDTGRLTYNVKQLIRQGRWENPKPIAAMVPAQALARLPVANRDAARIAARDDAREKALNLIKGHKVELISK